MLEDDEVFPAIYADLQLVAGMINGRKTSRVNATSPWTACGRICGTTRPLKPP